MLIKYEDLIKNIDTEIIKISKFLSQFTKIDINSDKLKKVAETTNFENLIWKMKVNLMNIKIKKENLNFLMKDQKMIGRII